MRKRLLFITCILIVSVILLPFSPLISLAAPSHIGSGIYDIGALSGEYIVDDGSTVTLIGTGEGVQMTCLNNVEVTLDSATIDNSGYDNMTPLEFTDGDAGSQLILAGTSLLKGGYKQPGLCIESVNDYGFTGMVTISGTGTLNAFGGLAAAGIGGGWYRSAGNITIDGATINATGGINGAGIGNGAPDGGYYIPGGTITILNSSVTANGGEYSAGIGGGYNGDGGTIIITDSNVTANGGYFGAGIGSGQYGRHVNNITINNSIICAKGGTRGAGIGSGYDANYDSITINSGTIIAYGGGLGGAGIGGGYSGGGGKIDIYGGIIYASMGSSGQHDIGNGDGGSGSALEISDTAAVFLENDSCVSPTTSHDHITFSVDTEEAYGLSVPAVWTPTFGAYLDLITLDYDANGGSGTVPDSVIQHIGTTTTVADGSGLSFLDYTFSRWHTQADGGGISYTAGSDFAFNYDTTLYAIWGETTAENSNITADVEETYNIIIPATVEFGNIEKDSGTVSQPFVVTASDVFIEPGDEIHVNFSSCISWTLYSSLFLMHDAAENEWDLPYALYNSSGQVGIGDDFATFTANGSESGHVDVDTSYIDYPGIYTDTMTFIISCP